MARSWSKTAPEASAAFEIDEVGSQRTLSAGPSSTSVRTPYSESAPHRSADCVVVVVAIVPPGVVRSAGDRELCRLAGWVARHVEAPDELTGTGRPAPDALHHPEAPAPPR